MEQKVNKTPYYIGLDLGTSSIGWAVVDTDFHLIRKSGKNLWGVRLFDEADTAKERRTFRRQRRTYNKQHWRIQLLKHELRKYVLSEDANFYRMIDGGGTKDFKLFVEKYNDIAFHQEFPTIYHLREALKDQNNCKRYIERNLYGRFLFLAIHDILKNRGHFLMPSSIDFSKKINSVDEIIKKINASIDKINDNYDVDIDNTNILTISGSKLSILEYNTHKQDPKTQFIKAITGSQFDCHKMLGLQDKARLSFADENYEELISEESDAVSEILYDLYDIYSDIRINKTIGTHGSYSASRIAVYNQHKLDLLSLKTDLKHIDKELGTSYFDDFFLPHEQKNDNTTTEEKKSPISYAYYIKKSSPKEKTKLTGKKVKREDLIIQLRKIKKQYEDKFPQSKVLLDIEREGYLDIPNNSDNRLIPYQAHLAELEQILCNFIDCDDKNSEVTQVSKKQIADNIKTLLEFKVPYFVGPLGNMGENRWVQKKPEFEDVDITPYNFEQVVDKQKTNEVFIKRMLRHCTYLNDEPCIQQETITYQKYIFYNTINVIKCNDRLFDHNQKESLYWLLLSGHPLKKKTIIKALALPEDAEITGFIENSDKPLPLSLSAHTRFRKIFPENLDNPFYQDFYDTVINEISLIDADELETRKAKIKFLANNWNTVQINDDQVDILAKLKSKKWGNLSKKLLCELRFVDDNGEYKSMLDILQNSSKNMMQILYSFNNKDIIDKENGEVQDISKLENLHEYLKQKYISPQARRTIIQANKILDEIVKIMDNEPESIAIEFTREKQLIKKMPKSRYEKLKELYAPICEEFTSVKQQLCKYENDQDQLDSRNLYLYFTQLGKDMYTGDPIDFNALLDKSQKKYDRDHIWPKSQIMDDSIDNLVLTGTATNQSVKGKDYPLSKEIQEKMLGFWRLLLSKNLISSKKFERLTRTTSLTDDELADFVNRQKTTLDWINRETAEILDARFNHNRQHSEKFIVYSKSNIVSRYRNEAKLFKFREMNNLHHAHDALLNIAIGKTLQEKLCFVGENNIANYNTETILKRYLKNDYVKYLATVFKYHDILVTKKTIIKNTGQYWNQNIVPAGKSGSGTRHEVKAGWGVNERGGYNSISIAFFSIIETDKGKKKIVPVPIVDCNHFYHNDRFINSKFESYIQNKYKNVKILLPILPINQKILIDDVPLRVGGKTDNSLSCFLTTEFILDGHYREYMRSLFAIQKKYPKLELTDEQWYHRKISNLKNQALFVQIRDKIVSLGENKKYPANTTQRVMKSKLGDPVLIFNQLPIGSQVEILTTLFTKLLKSNSANHGKLFGTNYVDYRLPLNISYQISLVKESITGFYTKRIDIDVSNGNH